MSAGRCSGCGDTNRSCKVIREHIRRCEQYRKLLETDPDKALEPEEDYRSWSARDKTDERIERRDRLVSETDAKHAAQEARFATPKDILE